MRRVVLCLLSSVLRLRLSIMTMMALLFLVTAPSASAATRVWSGGGGNGFWNNGANWVGGVVPVSGDALAFPTGTLNVTNTNNIVALRLGLTTFGGSNFTIHGSASVTNDAGILCTNASGVNTWNLFTTLGSNQTYNVVNSRAALNVNQTLSLNGKTLTLAGSGTNLLSGIVADFVGGGGIIINGGWAVMTRTNSLPDTITISQGN